MRYVDLLEEQILLENRIEFLRQKYVPLLWDLPFVDFKEHREEIEMPYVDDDGNEDGSANDPNKVFDHIAEFDPTPQKKYLQWILNCYLTATRYDPSYRKEVAGMNPEDLYKFEEPLAFYERMKPRLPVEMRDINRFKTLLDLENMLKSYRHAEIAQSNNEREREMEKQMFAQSEIVLNSSRYLILSPKTKEASVFFGRNTRWCTASAYGFNYFDDYNKDGPLYIVLDKPNNSRWQLHFETHQFMDETDSPIDLAAFLTQHPEVDEALGKVFKGKGRKLADGLRMIREAGSLKVREEEAPYSKSLLNFVIEKFRKDGVMFQNISDVVQINPKWVHENGAKLIAYFRRNKYSMTMARANVVEDPMWMLGFTFYDKFRYSPSRVKNMKTAEGQPGFTWYSWDYAISESDPKTTVHYMLDTLNTPRFAIRIKHDLKHFDLIRIRGWGSETPEMDQAAATYLLATLPKTGLTYADWDNDVRLPRFGGIDFFNLRPEWFDADHYDDGSRDDG